jgi:outer membrane protein assembly factor BamB
VRNRWLCLWTAFGLALITTSCCVPLSDGDSPLSPLSPLATVVTGKGSLSPKGWIQTTIDGLSCSYVETQIYEPLAWTDIDWDGQHIWLVDNITHELVALDRKGEIARKLPCPQIDKVPCNVTGVASTGKRIWIADVAHKHLYALDPQKGRILQEIEFTDTSQAIEWDGNALWIAFAESNRLEQWSEQGKILSSHPAKGGWTTGIAWDGSQIWYVDAVEQQVWALDPTTGNHERQSDVETLVSPTSFSGIAWTDDHLLLHDDMGGRLYAVPRDRQQP